MYASTRMLYSMSKDKLAFHSFGKTNKYGVPYLSLFARDFSCYYFLSAKTKW